MPNEKGNGLIIGLVVILLLTGVFGVYYFISQKNVSSTPQSAITQTVDLTPQPTSQATSSALANLPVEASDFPVYPGATFVESKDYPVCPADQMSGFSVCNAKTYTWQVYASNDLVNAFYRKDQSNSGWICSGGAGEYTDANNASGTTSCKKGSLNYRLDIDTLKGLSKITLIISKGTPTGQ